MNSRADLKPGLGQPHLVMAQVERSKNRTIEVMGTMRQRKLSTAAEKQRLFFPYQLQPCLHFSGPCQKDNPGSNT